MLLRNYKLRIFLRTQRYHSYLNIFLRVWPQYSIQLIAKFENGDFCFVFSCNVFLVSACLMYVGVGLCRVKVDSCVLLLLYGRSLASEHRVGCGTNQYNKPDG